MNERTIKLYVLSIAVAALISPLTYGGVHRLGVQLQLYTVPDNSGEAQSVALESVVQEGAALRLKIHSDFVGRFSLHEIHEGNERVLASNVPIDKNQTLWYPDVGGLTPGVVDGNAQWRLTLDTGQGLFSTAISFWVASASQVTFPPGPVSEEPATVEVPALDFDQAAVVAPASTLLRSVAGANGQEVARGASEAVLFRNFSPSVVLIVRDNGLGSGWVVNKEQRLVVTNYHVVEGLDTLSVIFKPELGGRASPTEGVRAEVVRVDQIADLALLRVAWIPESVQELELGSISDMAVGDDVHAIGHPAGEQWSYTRGIISQIRRDYHWSAGGSVQHNATIIQTQTPINPGNSGGPLMDDQGRVVGINSFVRQEAQGMSYAVSVEDLQNFLARSDSRYAPGYSPDTRVAGAPGGERKDKNWIASPGGGKGREGESVTSECGRTGRPVDRNKNGRPDAWVIDADCDGHPETFALDDDENGRPESIYVDRDGDGDPDLKIVDRDGDGKMDLWLIDENGDGKPDIAGFDRDDDGRPDVYQSAAG